MVFQAFVHELVGALQAGRSGLLMPPESIPLLPSDRSQQMAMHSFESMLLTNEFHLRVRLPFFFFPLKNALLWLFSKDPGGKILTPDWHHLLAFLNWTQYLKVFGFLLKARGLAITSLRFSGRCKWDGGNEGTEWLLGMGALMQISICERGPRNLLFTWGTEA